MIKTITVRFKVPGFHEWGDAPEHRVYLSKTHRHLFGFRVTIPVSHYNRDIEFHDLLSLAKESLDRFGYTARVRYSSDQFYDFLGMSCEQIANHVAKAVLDATFVRWCEVEVDEDGECSATVRKKPAKAGQSGG